MRHVDSDGIGYKEKMNGFVVVLPEMEMGERKWRPCMMRSVVGVQWQVLEIRVDDGEDLGCGHAV